MGDTTTVHDEIIRVDLDDAAALQKFQRLQQLADQFVQTALGGASPAGTFGAAAGGAMPIEATTSSAALAPPLAPPMPGGVAAPGAPGTTPSSGTVSSGSMTSPGATPGSGGGTGGGGGSGGGSGGSGGGGPTSSSAGGGNWSTASSGNSFAMTQGLRSFGHVAENFAQSTTIGGDTRAGLGMLGSLGVMAGNVPGAVLSVGSSILSSIFDTDTPMNNARRRAALEKRYGQSQLSMTIGDRDPDDDFLGYIHQAAYRAAMSPDEAVTAFGAYTRAAGGTISNKDPGAFLDATLYGVDPSTFGMLDRNRILGGARGSDDVNARLAGVGQGGFDIWGGLNDWLSRISGQFDRLIERGMKVDMDASAAFFESMAAVGLTGRQAADLHENLGAATMGARDQVLAPFKGMAQNAMLAKAMMSSDNLPDMLRTLEGMTKSPTGELDAIRALFGDGELTGLGLLATSPSLGVDNALALAKGTPRGKRFKPEGQSRETVEWERVSAERNASDIIDRSLDFGDFKLANYYEEQQLNERVEQGRKVYRAAQYWSKKLTTFGKILEKAGFSIWSGAMGFATMFSGGADEPSVDREEP